MLYSNLFMDRIDIHILTVKVKRLKECTIALNKCCTNHFLLASGRQISGQVLYQLNYSVLTDILV